MVENSGACYARALHVRVVSYQVHLFQNSMLPTRSKVLCLIKVQYQGCLPSLSVHLGKGGGNELVHHVGVSVVVMVISSYMSTVRV